MRSRNFHMKKRRCIKSRTKSGRDPSISTTSALWPTCQATSTKMRTQRASRQLLPPRAGSCMLRPGRRRHYLQAATHGSRSNSSGNANGSVSPSSFPEISPEAESTDGVQRHDGVAITDSACSGGEQRESAAARFMKGTYGQSTWAKMLLSLPLEVAAAASRADSHYLQKRKRKNWWSKEHFPRVTVQLIFALSYNIRAYTWSVIPVTALYAGTLPPCRDYTV